MKHIWLKREREREGGREIDVIEIHKTSKIALHPFVITARKVFTFLSEDVWFLEMSDDDDDGVDAFLSTFTLSPRRYNVINFVKSDE